jgi:amino acid permease
VPEARRKDMIIKTLTVLAVLSLVGLLIISVLLAYHYSFDPYSWLKPQTDAVESRDLWNIRKDYYKLLLLIFSVATFVFGFLPLINRLGFFRSKNLQ